ncbi:MAG: DUF975 family protein [Clostridium sp.]|nr:DUF975 family protein [Clostridium sp.]
MNNYLSSASLKAQARGQLLGKYKVVICIYLLHLVCTVPFTFSISSLIGTGSLGAILVFCLATFLFDLFAGFFTAGEAYVYLKTACNQIPAVSDLFHCFREDSQKVVRIQAVLSAVSIACSLPALIISHYMSLSLARILLGGTESGVEAGSLETGAGLFLAYVIFYVAGVAVDIFVGLMLSQAYYLMLDFPEYSPSQLIKMSIQLMKGNKGRLFYIQLSFIPLMLVSIFSFGIALLWVLPYREAVSANFYLDLIKKKQEPSG